MRRKAIVSLLLFSIICFFMYYELNKPKLDILPYPKYKIKSVTIQYAGDVEQVVSKEKKEKILDALYKVEKYEDIIEDHHWAPPPCTIAIETTENRKIYIRNMNDTFSIAHFYKASRTKHAGA